MKYILTGRVVTMNASRTVLESGAIYVDGNTIVSVVDANDNPPDGFAGATRIDTQGVLFPGLIELHNHLSYNILQLWSVPKRFQDRGQWQRHAQYVQLVNGPMLLLSQSTDSRVLAAIARYAETKCLLGGVTTSQGISLKSEHLQKYYHGALRVVEDPTDSSLLKATTHIPDLHAADWDGFNTELKKAHCLLLHLSEGFDDAALAAFKALQLQPDGPWAISSALAGIHCAALGDAEFAIMQQHGGSMIWSPLSNMMLYGQTAKVGVAKAHGVPIALGSDWSPSGSKNLLHELKVAKVANDVFNFGFKDEDLVALATCDPAAIVKWDRLVGSLESGKRADITAVAAPAAGDVYSGILRAKETDVMFVIIDGKATVGTPALMAQLGVTGETLSVNGEARVINYGKPDPDITPISYEETVKVLSGALAKLPEIPKAPHLVPAPGARPTRQWTLALDEQAQTGFVIRPMLPYRGEATGPGPHMLDAASVAALPIGPVPLDKVSVVDDPTYAAQLNGQMNIPADVKDGLKVFYPV